MTRTGRPLGMRRNFRTATERKQPPGRNNRCCARCRLLEIPDIDVITQECHAPLECYCTRPPRLLLRWAEALHRVCTGWRKPHGKEG